ncbi:molybdopterin molybdotransferase MoeA [Aurantiacibacter zhengii]|uniref:Molybdopterin molybdenumtransferase n=1 Tax=Aurantiacibacter zhengii TaxID=2307003 RepID=A0A418NVX7_9SPHN|nr:molybdopterin molybdotransferase MoeA [Aurantiacibacter zhengii]RIV88777.1 molybdopterin molybdenumtransferase MoeA [Aurantiacibacter zhengii]
MSAGPPIPLEEAQTRLCAFASPLPAVSVETGNAAGYYLAEDLIARRTQPGSDLSAMDGYAVRADDLAGPWTVVGESAAGHPFGKALKAGEAVRISTGAIMPQGAGAVLLQENAARHGNTVSCNGEGEPGAEHIRRKGFDFSEGDLLLQARTCVGPAQLALALAGGNATLPVHGRPSLAVIDSGDELSTDPANCDAHQIPASNGAAIAAMAASLVSQIHRIGPVRDRIEALLESLQAASDADVIVTSGGASVGDHDLVRPALEKWGATIEFWRVAIKPGKPLLVATRGKQIVLGLPGNPVSSFVTAYFFLLPLLRKMAGARHFLPLPMPMACNTPLPAGGPRAEFLRGRIVGGAVELIEERDSSALRALAGADVLIGRDIDAPSSKVGDVVPTYRIQNGGIA